MTHCFNDTLGIDHDDPADAITPADMAELKADHMADLTDAVMPDDDTDDLDTVQVTAAHRQAARDAKTDAAQVDGLGRRAIRAENRDASRFAGMVPLAMIDPVMIDSITGAAGTVAVVVAFAVFVWLFVRYMERTTVDTVDVAKVATMTESVLEEMLDLNSQMAALQGSDPFGVRELGQAITRQDHALEGIREVCDDLCVTDGGMNHATRTSVDQIKHTLEQLVEGLPLSLFVDRLDAITASQGETDEVLERLANIAPLTDHGTRLQRIENQLEQVTASLESIDHGGDFDASDIASMVEVPDADDIASRVRDYLDLPEADDIAALVIRSISRDMADTLATNGSVDEDEVAAAVIDALDSRDRIDAEALAEGVAAELAKRLATPVPGMVAVAVVPDGASFQPGVLTPHPTPVPSTAPEA
jgi:hypothetical protein